MRKLNEFYPLQDQYGGRGGGGGGAGGSIGSNADRRTHGSNLSKGKVIYQVNQEVNSLDSIEIFKTAEVKAATDRRGVVEAPKEIEIKNSGETGLGLVLKVPIWTGDHTQSGSNYLQMVLGQNEKLVLPTSRIIDSVDSGFNQGTTVTGFSGAGTSLKVDSGVDVDHTTSADMGSDTAAETLYLASWTSDKVNDTNYFRIGDLVRVENEIMEVVDIGPHTGLGTTYLTVKRGLFGSSAAAHADGIAVEFPFFNTTRKYNAFSSVCTDESGVFSSRNFFGLGRASTIEGSGIVPGSVAFKFYSEPYQEMGCTDLSPNSESGLTSGEVYYIKVAVNGGSEYEIVFTVDSTKLGGSNGIISKIQAVLDTQYYTSGATLKGKRISVNLVGGDVRWTFHERKSGSTIALTAGTTGDTSHDLVANALGVFPASVETAVVTSLPPDVVYDSLTYQERPNKIAMLYDNGNGQLVGGAGSGTINYETGAILIRSYKNADITYSVSHSSGMAGRASSTKSNIVEEVYAKSTNAKINTTVSVTVKG